jgi:hypothetical protein
MAAIMNDLCNMSELVGFNSLVKGATYRILNAHRCMSPQGVRLFLKLRTHPHNIFVKLPNYCVNIFTISDIDKINQHQLLLNFSYWGKLPNGDPSFIIRHKGLRMPTFAQMRAIGLLGH